MSAYSARIRRRRTHRAGASRLIIILIVVLLLAVGAGGAAAVGYVMHIADGVHLSDLKPKTAGSVSQVLARDGHGHWVRLGFIKTTTLRTAITTAQMPDNIREATVAIEDQRFYQHKGVDYQGVIRAGVNNVFNHKDVQGGSTLTMQLIRNVYTHNRKRTLKRKIQEASLAHQLEKRHPGRAGKEYILTSYLNNVPYGTTLLGQQAIGISAAARVYFNEPASRLTLPQAALLAGLPQAPTSYDPLRHPAAARTRRNQVLTKMAQLKMITPAAAQAAELTRLNLHPNRYYGKVREGYILDYIRRELIHHLGAKVVQKGGLRVYSSINLRWQKIARKVMKQNLPLASDPAQALVAMDPATGRVLAMANSIPYGRGPGQSTFNIAANGQRQAGSTMKVIDLMGAIREGADIKRVEYDSHPLNFIDPGTGTKIDVHTDDGSYSGPTTLFEGLVKSDNTVYQQLDLDLTPPVVTKTAHDMGVISHFDNYPSEGLGGFKHGVTPLEMADAYATVASGGVRHYPTAIIKVVYPNGKVSTKLGHPKPKRIFTDGMTDQAIQAMHANIERGTGTHANFGCDSEAGKTGTTSSFTDAWFNGFVPGLETDVWIGYPKSTISMTNVPPYGEEFGGDSPADIWHAFMSAVAKCKPWPPIKHPFVSKTFTGRYVIGSGNSACDIDPTQCNQTTTTPSTTPAKPTPGGGGIKVPPQIYQPPTHTPTPTPAPVGGGGGGVDAPTG
jgi:penicillin-binding protein 1A